MDYLTLLNSVIAPDITIRDVAEAQTIIDLRWDKLKVQRLDKIKEPEAAKGIPCSYTHYKAI